MRLGAAYAGAANAGAVPVPVSMPPPLPRPVHASRLPRDVPPLGPDGLPATRWTDPRVAAAYAEREDEAERAAVWPLLAAAVCPPEPRHVSGRPDGIVLELGSGPGALARHLADEHWLRVYAFDVSPSMHRIGAARFRDAWVMRALPDPSGRIPLRRAHCTAGIVQRLLLHMAHPCLIIGLLTEARRVLRPGSALVIVEADTRAGKATVEMGEAGDVDDVDDGAAYIEHYRLTDGGTLPVTAWRHSPETIVSCLTAAGFTLEEIQTLRVPSAPGAPSAPEDLLLYRARAC